MLVVAALVLVSVMRGVSCGGRVRKSLATAVAGAVAGATADATPITSVAASMPAAGRSGCMWLLAPFGAQPRVATTKMKPSE